MAEKIKERYPALHLRYAFWSKKYGKGIDDCIIAGNIEKVKLYELPDAINICNGAFEDALKKYGITCLQELKQEKVKEFECYLQSLTESRLGLS